MPGSENNEKIQYCNAYIGIGNEAAEGQPTVCLEFPVSIKIFAFALLISLLEKACIKKEAEENQYKDSVDTLK